jgi:hypothetical protein
MSTATHVNPKFRKEVKAASRDKISGKMVQRLRTIFAQGASGEKFDVSPSPKGRAVTQKKLSKSQKRK